MIYKRIKKLCKENGISVNKLEQELSISKGSLCRIDVNKPSAEKLQKIADYFGVTVEYLRIGLEIIKDPAAVEPVNRKLAGEEGLISILSDIYGRCEDISIKGKYFSNHYYSIGIGKARYALEEVDFERLYASVKQIITQMTDVIKKDEYNIRHEYQSSANEPPSAEIYADFRKNGEIIPRLEKKYGYIQDNVESDYLMPQAAHERTDIEVTDEMRKRDDITHEDKSCCTIVPPPHFKTVGEAQKFLRSREHLAAWKTDGLSDQDIITMANSILSNGD